MCQVAVDSAVSVCRAATTSCWSFTVATSAGVLPSRFLASLLALLRGTRSQPHAYTVTAAEHRPEHVLFEQELRGLQLPIAGCVMQCGVLIVVLGLHVGVVLQEHLCAGHLAEPTGKLRMPQPCEHLAGALRRSAESGNASFSWA